MSSWRKKTLDELENQRLFTLSEFATYLNKDSGNLSRTKVWQNKSKIYPVYAKVGNDYIKVNEMRMIDIKEVEITRSERTIVK